MFRPFAFVLVLLGAALTLVGCVSAPEKPSEDACLVLIPTAMINDSPTGFGRKYFLQFSDKRKELQISDTKQSYLLTIVKGPGVKIVGIRSEVDKSRNFQGQDGFRPVDLELPYVRGHMVALDTVFVMRMTRIDSTSYQSDTVPVKVDATYTDPLIAKFKANEDNAAWFPED